MHESAGLRPNPVHPAIHRLILLLARAAAREAARSGKADGLNMPAASDRREDA